MTLTLPTYPARPIQGGRFNLAAAKFGDWFYEPKYNGWRTLVHAPTGTLFNRQGKVLSLQQDFKQALAQLKNTGLGWVDCEALERRHKIGRGSLVILDVLTLGDGTRVAEPLSQRRYLLEVACALAQIRFFKDLNLPMPENSAFLTMQYFGGEDQLWDILQQCNSALGCQFYEGMVAKRQDSIYPFQLRNAEEACPFWVKHRWPF